MHGFKRNIFSSLAYIFFDRLKALWFCTLWVVASLLLECICQWKGFFSCSGAIVSIAGIFLNIKHSLHFHLKLPKTNIHNMLKGAGPFGSSTMSKEEENRVDNIISDEIFGVTFMIVGTLIWAYGVYLITAINKLV